MAEIEDGRLVDGDVETVPSSYCSQRTDLIELELPRAKTIGANAFANCGIKGLLSLPNVGVIGESAFAGCKDIERLELPKVRTIMYAAFDGCTGITGAITLPEAERIEQCAFQLCGIASVHLPNAEYLNGFNMCRELRFVRAGKAQTIGENAFEACFMLGSGTTNNLSFPEVTTIEDHAFHNCNSLQHITAPKLKIIRTSAFADCTWLGQVSFPEVTEIFPDAFEHCEHLKRISVPKLRHIYQFAFTDCPALETVDVGIIKVQAEYDIVRNIFAKPPLEYEERVLPLTVKSKDEVTDHENGMVCYFDCDRVVGPGIHERRVERVSGYVQINVGLGGDVYDLRLDNVTDLRSAVIGNEDIYEMLPTEDKDSWKLVHFAYDADPVFTFDVKDMYYVATKTNSLVWTIVFAEHDDHNANFSRNQIYGGGGYLPVNVAFTDLCHYNN